MSGDKEDHILLMADRLAFSYSGGDVLFSDVSFFLRCGEKIGLLGDNGVGKSSLLHVIVGLLSSAAGTVSFDRQTCWCEEDYCRLRRQTGYLLQNSDEQLFCETVLDDVAFAPQNYGLPASDAKRIAQWALEYCGAAHLASRHPYELSAGEQKLSALAGVLAQQPKLLLLDEPTNMLDVATKERIVALLENSPLAMVLISHDPVVLSRLCERFYLLRDGSMSACSREEALSYGYIA